MAIDKIIVEYFTCFDNLEVEFSKGINIFIGENGTGKTHLLKLLYAFCEIEIDLKSRPKDLLVDLKDYFDINSEEELLNKESKSQLTFYFDEQDVRFSMTLWNQILVYNFEEIVKDKIPSIFIPATEMLSHSRGFLSLARELELPFDKTQIDIISKAGLPPAKNHDEFERLLMNKITAIVGGSILYENDTFYSVRDGKTIKFSLESEGLKKFGVLWKLLENGLLKTGTVLFWDEPETNINPRLIPHLVDILIDIANHGIQVFLSTHDYFLAKYFEINNNNVNSLLFHSLFREKDTIKSETNEKFTSLLNNSIISEQFNIYREEAKKVLD